MEDQGGKGPSERELAAVRVLEESMTIPLDQEGPVFSPPHTYWQRLRQRIACKLQRHSWSKAWEYRPLVPADHDVARMLSDGACWPVYSVKVCAGCLLHVRRRVA